MRGNRQQIRKPCERVWVAVTDRHRLRQAEMIEYELQFREPRDGRDEIAEHSRSVDADRD
jgi:hypothetical protein